MKKVLYHSFYPNDASAFYRSTAVFPYINHPDLQIKICNPHSFADFCGFDTLFLQRPCEESHLNLIKLAKDTGLKVIIDYDDDPLSLPVSNPMYEYYSDHKKNIMECLLASDEIWVSTEGIKKAFRLYNKNIHVIPNAHNDHVYPVKDKRSFTYNKKAMWRGGHSHTGDMYDIGMPEKIINMVNENSDWEFVFLGQRFEYLELRCGNNYIAKSGASTIQFYKQMQKENACIFFYPLADNIFNRSKSNCSWLESTYSGSAFFGNKNLPEFDKHFVYSISNVWEGIKELGSEDLNIANKLSWEYICDELLLSKVNSKRIERLLV